MPSSSELKWSLVSGGLNKSDSWRLVELRNFRNSLFSALQRNAHRKSTINSGISRGRPNHAPVDLGAAISGVGPNPLPPYQDTTDQSTGSNTRDAGILVSAAMALTRAAVSPHVNEVLCNNRKVCARSYFFRVRHRSAFV